ncbi:hypothetical protein [Robertmurraya massiliosenegalensis]|uniref:hypothetical protein n=1 Tax=Robertmurraya massiliosenegalensis TaxID=1287657 RepID=UPI00030EC464|nr:hypothetical protein [Robertmurraya massiliosenegalensis]
MIPLSNGQIERAAVTSINTEANNYSLIPNIQVGDKGISFDGDISVMSDISEKTSSLLGRVPVQIKGKYVDNFTKGNRDYPVKLDDLRNFYDSNGAIYFVVEVDQNMDTKIFYKHLLPTELRLLIIEYGKQGKRKLIFRPLSETNLYRICLGFLKESKKQAPILIESNLHNKEDFTSFHITSLTFDPTKEETSDIFEHDFIFYGKYNELELSVPIGVVRITAEFSQNRETVIVDGEKNEVNIEVKRNKEKVTMLLEDSLELEFLGNKKFNFKFYRFKSISTQLRVLPILKSILDGQKVSFVKESIFIEGAKPTDKKWIGRIKDLYDLFCELQSAFTLLNLSNNIEFKVENDNNKTLREIEIFTDVVLRNDLRRINVKEQPNVGFISYTLCGIYLVLFYNSKSEQHIINGFSENLLKKETRVEINEEVYPCSPYIQLSKDVLTSSQNLNIDIIKSSFLKLDDFINEQLFGPINYFCLLCIEAFDENQNIELLKLAEYIYGKYKKGLEKDSYRILRINQLQVQLRLNGTLDELEIEELINMKSSNSADMEVQFCTNVLLGSKKEAEFFFGKLDISIQTTYKEYPIYHLYNNL